MLVGDTACQLTLMLIMDKSGGTLGEYNPGKERWHA